MGVTVLPASSPEVAAVAGGRQAIDSTENTGWQRPGDWPGLPIVTPTDNKFVGLVGVTNDDANFLALNATVAGAATLTIAQFDWTSSSTDASTYTTNANTLTAGRTYILSVENSHGTSASAVSAITSSTSGVPTFTVQATTQFNSNLNRVTILTATPTSTFFGPLTINFGGTTQTGCIASIEQATGVGNLTADAVVQSKTATGSSGTASVTLDNALATGSFVFAAQSHAAATASAPAAGYTELNDQTTATPGQALQTLRTTSTPGSTTVSATFTSAAWGIVAVEIKRGDYTVDWGDGTTETIVSGTQANHQYTYSSLTTAVTTRGYKTATVVITPNGYWTTCNLQVKHSQSGLNAYETKWLDMTLSGPALATISIGNATPTVNFTLLERAAILSSFKTSYSYQFGNCTRLQSAFVASSATVTDCTGMFDFCQNLRVAPWFDTSSVTNMSFMFESCRELKLVPAYNTAAATNMSYMFAGCTTLKSVPTFTTTAATNMRNMFASCLALATIPALNTASVTNMSTMFSGCTALASVPSFTTTSATDTSSMFNGCTALTALPAFNLAAVTTTSSMVSSCPSLASVAVTGLTVATSFASCNLSKGAIETIFDNLGKANGAQTVTISSNWGAPAAISKASSGTTSGSTTVTISDTSSLAVGMEISGVGISDAVAVTFQDTGDTVTRTAHGIANDTPVSFASITSTTGIATYTRYYVVNATANTFQVSDTVGGSAKALTTDGSGTCLYGTTITSITANTSIELSIPASATGSVTTSSALLKRSKARLKGWTVSG